MKKRISAIFITVCMLFAMTVPAFAAISDSEYTGYGDDAVKISATKTSYTIYNGATVDVTKDIVAVTSKGYLVDPASLDYSITRDPKLAFSTGTTGMVSCMDESGSATLTISTPNGKVKTNVTLTARATNTGNATGFKFKSSSYIIPVDVYAEDFEMTIVATPEGSSFSGLQISALQGSNWGYGLFDNAGAVPTFSTSDDNKEVTVLFSGGELTGVTHGQAFNTDNTFGPGNGQSSTNSRTITFTADYAGFDGYFTTSKSKANVSLRTVKAAPAKVIGSMGTVNIKVGETIEASKGVKVGPSNATTDPGFSFEFDYAGNRTSVGYAAFTGDGNEKIIGVAPGEVKVIATADVDGETKTASYILKVSAYSGTPSSGGDNVGTGDLALVSKTATVLQGTTYTIAIKNKPSDAEVVYTSNNTSIATVAPNGVVTAKNPGVVEVTAEVDGIELTTTITVTAKTTTGGGTTGGGGSLPSVPQTGIATLAPLF